MEILKKRGRPIKPDAKRRRICIRVKATDVAKLDFLTKEKGMTQAEIFEMGLKMVYNVKRIT